MRPEPWGAERQMVFDKGQLGSHNAPYSTKGTIMKHFCSDGRRLR